MNGLNTKYSGKFTGPDRGFSLGFTLIEIVAALGIFIVGFVSVMSLFLGAYKMQDEARNLITESLVAESIYTTIREPELDGLQTVFSNVASPGVIGISKSVDYPGYLYYITYEPFGVNSSDERRAYVTIHVFEEKYEKAFETIYTKDYSELDQAQKELYDTQCLKFYTIIGDI